MTSTVFSAYLAEHEELCAGAAASAHRSGGPADWAPPALLWLVQRDFLQGGSVEQYLEKTVQLFSYLTDKDLFAEIYRNQLAKRLLNQRSASDDAYLALMPCIEVETSRQMANAPPLCGLARRTASGSSAESRSQEEACTGSASSYTMKGA